MGLLKNFNYINIHFFEKHLCLFFAAAPLYYNYQGKQWRSSITN
jgi:hypothetical protein